MRQPGAPPPAASGSNVIVECRANKVRARQVALPFYKRVKK